VLPLKALRHRLRGRPAPAAAAAQTPPVPPSSASPKRAIRPTIGRAAVQSSFDASCRALGTDYVDLYLLHEHVPAALETGAVDLLLELQATRRVRTLGLAANGANYLDLAAADVAQWEVLQYEFGPAWPAHAALPGRFPDKTHIFHSCLKNVAALGGGRTPGEVLRDCLAANPRGKVLFSSTDPRHIAGNLRALTA
jgi:diketogulonate reductase-like aldo/keto reductase